MLYFEEESNLMIVNLIKDISRKALLNSEKKNHYLDFKNTYSLNENLIFSTIISISSNKNIDINSRKI